MGKKILLMYISEHSGHHQASIAVEKAIMECAPKPRVRNVNAFRYTNPALEMLVHKTYMGIIKKHPDIWGRIYDNPDVVKKTERVRNFMNRAASRKIGSLIEEFVPDAIGCTQAFPCIMAAEYKKAYRASIPLVGILTDYAPHTYWVHEQVNVYVVPSPEVGAALARKGVPKEKIKVLGTPIDPIFEMPRDKPRIRAKLGLSQKIPVILVMGGTHGIGPGEKLIKALDKSRKDFHVVVVAGANKRLLRKIKKIRRVSEKKIIVLGFTTNVHDLMEVSTLIISKPGGMTTAEALAKSLPMIILNALPGQEEFNTKALIEKGAAVRAVNECDAVSITEDLLQDRSTLRKMQDAAGASAKPSSSTDIAKLLLSLSRNAVPVI